MKPHFALQFTGAFNVNCRKDFSSVDNVYLRDCPDFDFNDSKLMLCYFDGEIWRRLQHQDSPIPLPGKKSIIFVRRNFRLEPKHFDALVPRYRASDAALDARDDAALAAGWVNPLESPARARRVPPDFDVDEAYRRLDRKDRARELGEVWPVVFVMNKAAARRLLIKEQ